MSKRRICALLRRRAPGPDDDLASDVDSEFGEGQDRGRLLYLFVLFDWDDQSKHAIVSTGLQSVSSCFEKTAELYLTDL